MELIGKIRRFVVFAHRRRIKGFDVPDEPYFDPASTDQFNQLLRSSQMYLEFGSGGSTTLASRLGVRTITVENDKHYANAVRQAIGTAAPNQMIVVDIGLTKAWGQPVFQSPTPRRLRRWAAYVDRPLEALGEPSAPFPDLVLVDGRFRRACALAVAHAAQQRHVPVTICFDDYADRSHYATVEDHLGPPALAGRMAIFRVGETTAPVPPDVIASAKTDHR